VIKLENGKKLKASSFTVFIVIVIIFSLLSGSLIGYWIGNLATSEDIADLQEQVSTLQERTSNIQSTSNTYGQSNTFLIGENVSLAPLYEEVKDAIVVIRGLMLQYDVFRRPYYSQVQGSGFVYNFNGQIVVITNYHVVEDAINITVTFINGNGYAATVLGLDPYADLAVLSTDASQNDYSTLEIVDSATLQVGDPVIAVGNPYGLAGSMTTGIVSALGRTITEEMSGYYPIANVIQMSAPINSGNSGGPLLNYQGQVIGITTAIVSDSQGLGFAIPSSTVKREIESLITEGSFNQHPWLGASGTDMTYEIANAIGIDVTYGWLVVQVASGGPADDAGLRGGTSQVTVAGVTFTVGGDVVIALEGTRIKGIDDLSTFLEENTSPDQTLDMTIIRNGEIMTIQLTLGTRPSPT